MSLKPTGRQLLVSSAAVAAALALIPGGNDVTVDASAATPPVVYAPAYNDDNMLGPGVGWNGTVDTGFASWTDLDGGGRTGAPVQPTITTAAPIAAWMTIGRERFSSDFVVTVAARATRSAAIGEGISHVDFYCEGAGVRASNRSIYNYRDCNDKPQMKDGYHCTLNWTAFTAFLGGQINVCAIITALDGTMQKRVLGVAAPGAAATLMNFFPAATPYSHRINFNSSGIDAVPAGAYPAAYAEFTTLEKCIAYAAGQTTSGFIPPTMDCAEIRIKQSGTLGALADAGYAQVQKPLGWTTINADDGLAVTFTRTTYVSDADSTWIIGIRGIRFQGNELTFDYINKFEASATDGPYMWGDGVTMTSSRNLAAYLGADRTPNTVPVFRQMTHCKTEYAQFAAFCIRVFNNTHSYSNFDFANGVQTLIGNRSKSYGRMITTIGVNFLTSVNQINVQYTGAQPTAEVFQNASGGVMGLYAPLGNLLTTGPAASGYATLSAYITALNAVHVDFTFSLNVAVTPNDFLTDRAPKLLSSQLVNCNPLSTGVLLSGAAFAPPHRDISQTSAGGTNLLVENNVWLDAYEIQTWFQDGPTAGYGWVNNFMQQGPGSTLCQISGNSGTTQKHNAHFNNAIPDQGFTLLNATAWDMDAYSYISANLHSYGGWVTPSAGQRSALGPVLENQGYLSTQFTVTGGGTQTTAGTQTTSLAASTAEIYPGHASWDFTPAAGLLTNLKASRAPYDILGDARRSSDAMGPRAMKYTSRTVTRADWLAVYPEELAPGGAGSMTLTYKEGAGNTGATKVLTINLSVA